MKAYELQAKEGPGALVLVERKEEALGPADVRVRVRATSINYRDLNIFRGAKNRSAPVVPLSDGAGEVVAVGKEVTRLKLGDKVAANFFPTWREGLLSDAHHAQALGGGHDGMLREEVVLDEAAWVKFPAHLSFEQAATLPCAGLTAYHALFDAAHVGPGDTVLVEGTGGVSLFALQLAKAAGARVVLTSKSADKRERATRLGADHVIDYTADPKWGESARAWTGGRGVDLAVEVGGQGTFDQATASLRYGGTLAVVGGLTGVQGGVNLYPLLQKTLRVRGIYVGSVDLFERFARALDTAKIVPVIDETYSFADAGKAYTRIASGEHFGKIVIRGG
jgi:NADPH:quinone reductase-like Zn-dependent oxidoreductase